MYDADGVADGATLAGGWTPPRWCTLISVRPVLAPEAFVASTRIRCAVTAPNVTTL